MAEFAQGGNQYRGAAGTGAGPFILDRERPRDAVDKFLQTYETTKRWKQQDEENKMRKMRYLDEKLADLDFKTDGVLPSPKVQKYLMGAKGKMQNAQTRFYMEGVDPTDPSFYDAYNKSNQDKKNYEVVVDGLRGANTIVNNLLNDAATRPNDYDQDEVADWVKKVYDAEPEATVPGEKTIIDYMNEIPRPRSKSWDEIFTESIKDVEPSSAPSIEGGAVYENKGLGGVTEPERVDFISKKFISNEPLHNKTMEMWTDLHEKAVGDIQNGIAPDEGAASKVIAIQDMAKKMGTSPEEAYAVMLGMPSLHTEKVFKSFTPTEREQQKAIWKNWGFGENDERQLEADNWQLLQMLTGKGGFVYGDDGSYSYTYAPDMEIGRFADEEGKSTVNSLTDYQWDVNPTTGRPIFKYRTTKSGDAWNATDNQKEIANLVFNNARYGTKAGAGASQFYDWIRKLKTPDGESVWNEQTKNIDLEKASKLFKEEEALGEAELLAKQQEELGTGVFAPKNILPQRQPLDGMGTDYAEKIENKILPLTVSQRRRYNEFVMKKKATPTNQEVLQILQGKETQQQSPATQQNTTQQKSTTQSAPQSDDWIDSILNFEKSKGYSNYGFTSEPSGSVKNIADAKKKFKTEYLPLIKDLPAPLQAVAGDFAFNSEDPRASLMVATGILKPEDKKGMYVNGKLDKELVDLEWNKLKDIAISMFNKNPTKFLDAFDAERLRSYENTNGADKHLDEWKERIKVSRQKANQLLTTAPKKDWSKYKR